MIKFITESPIWKPEDIPNVLPMCIDSDQLVSASKRSDETDEIIHYYNVVVQQILF